jgi:hypothetical protein
MPKRKKPPPTTLPATLLDDQVAETIAHWFDKFVAQIHTEHSHSFLRRLLRRLVRDGQMPLRRVIEWTGDKNAAMDADAALRDIAEDMLERGEELPKLLTAYLISHPKPSRGRGRRETDNFLRYQCIAICVGCARERWSTVINLTRNPEALAPPSEEAHRAPSICSLVSRVCHSRGIPIDEKRVKQIHDRFAEFMPVHQGWLLIKSNSAI